MSIQSDSEFETQPIPLHRVNGGSEPRLFNRELSWLAFNQRVLDEAGRSDNPLLERFKFLSIFESNLDEFFMVRVSGLMDQKLSGVFELSPDGLSPSEQLRAIMKQARPLRAQASRLLKKVLLPGLEESGVSLLPYNRLTERQKSWMADYFSREVFPLCTPLLLYPAATFPFISNRSLNLLVILEGDDGEQRLARVKVPTVISRAVRLPGKRPEFMLVEEVIQSHLAQLFPGVRIVGSYLFRVIRDADIEIKKLEAADLITSVEETIRMRRFGDPILLEIQKSVPEAVVQQMMRLLDLDPNMVFKVDGLVGYEAFSELASIEKPSLRFPSFTPFVDPSLEHFESIFSLVSKEDVLIHHPYESFHAVEEFCAAAGADPKVMGIKQTLYRVGTKSPIVESLMKAAEEGKQVAAMVELKARFDETNNLVWARALERAGVHVTFGFADTKTHCKICLIVRREGDEIRQYAHIGTGNYNPATARLYSDLGLLTCSSEITQDIGELFNYLTGFSRQTPLRKLLAAPANLRERMLELIHAETELHRKTGQGHIMIKVNAIVDPEAVEALYEASQAGVQVDLIVRGICCLRPGIKGVSENIRVISVVGRFLEHSRIYYFENGGNPITYIGSADLMRRSLDRRIEVLTPVERPELIRQLKLILDTFQRDNTQAWELFPSGEYVRRRPQKAAPFSAQQTFMDWAARARRVEDDQ